MPICICSSSDQFPTCTIFVFVTFIWSPTFLASSANFAVVSFVPINDSWRRATSSAKSIGHPTCCHPPVEFQPVDPPTASWPTPSRCQTAMVTTRSLVWRPNRFFKLSKFTVNFHCTLAVETSDSWWLSCRYIYHREFRLCSGRLEGFFEVDWLVVVFAKPSTYMALDKYKIAWVHVCLSVCPISSSIATAVFVRSSLNLKYTSDNKE